MGDTGDRRLKKKNTTIKNVRRDKKGDPRKNTKIFRRGPGHKANYLNKGRAIRGGVGNGCEKNDRRIVGEKRRATGKTQLGQGGVVKASCGGV